jgi:hypothetical protein
VDIGISSVAGIGELFTGSAGVFSEVFCGEEQPEIIMTIAIVNEKIILWKRILRIIQSSGDY